MTRREVVRAVIEGRKPPYVPWSFGFTHEAHGKLRAHYAVDDLETVLDNHFLGLGTGVGFSQPIGNGRYRDHFGVVWNRSVDKDIGVVENSLLPEPTLRDLKLPDPLDEGMYRDILPRIAQMPDRYRIYSIGFSLYERAWTLRGMENLMMDMVERPQFVHDLLNALGDYNITIIRKAVTYDIDAIHFGDDWGQQHGLQMGPESWRRFILPVLRRMYGEVHRAGKPVSIHCCGDVDEVFPELVDAGVNLFNPFQPEVMDVFALMREYRGRLAFHGGLSTQRTLPYGSVAEVRAATRRLLEAGSNGGFILAPAHAVPSDVPVENMVAFIEEAKAQAAVN